MSSSSCNMQIKRSADGNSCAKIKASRPPRWSSFGARADTHTPPYLEHRDVLDDLVCHREQVAERELLKRRALWRQLDDSKQLDPVLGRQRLAANPFESREELLQRTSTSRVREQTALRVQWWALEIIKEPIIVSSTVSKSSTSKPLQ